MTGAGGDRGYTLVELLVVMTIFGIVMTIITVSFNRIVSSSGQMVKGIETDIGGLIGLELLRVDVGLAGFGLPWSVGEGTTYAEAGGHTVGGFAGTQADLFNDSPGGPPRAFALGNNVGFNGSDYLVLKGSALGMTRTSRGWSYLNYSTVGVTIKPAKGEGELTPGSGDRVIVVNTGARGGDMRRDLVTRKDGETTYFSMVFDQKERLDADFLPKNREDRYLIYGIARDAVSFPFNRVDYFIAPASDARTSSICSPGTGVLQKGVIDHGSSSRSGGGLNSFPVLDCVADMQVIFLLDLNHDGTLVKQDLEDYRQALLEADPRADVAEAIREHVKEVRIFILAQQGKRDQGYRYPYKNPDSVFVLGDKVNGRVWKESELKNVMGPGWVHYRWKVYTIVDQPKNLQ